MAAKESGINQRLALTAAARALRRVLLCEPMRGAATRARRSGPILRQLHRFLHRLRRKPLNFPRNSGAVRFLPRPLDNDRIFLSSSRAPPRKNAIALIIPTYQGSSLNVGAPSIFSPGFWFATSTNCLDQTSMIPSASLYQVSPRRSTMANCSASRSAANITT